MEKIYKAYDIRGIYPDHLNEDEIFKIGRAFADLLKSELPQKKEVTLVVGRDMRLSSPQLAEHLIQGIIEQGVNVLDIGLASTPSFYYAVSVLGVDGGMQVSASHNPKDYNGVKIVRQKALPVGFDNGLSEIEKNVRRNQFISADPKGRVTLKEGLLQREVDFSLSFADISKLKPLKIVADAANAMGAPFLSALFAKLPCELVKMNFTLDGSFPAHEADPFKDENVKDLMQRVVAEKADLGIATDGDGDRIFFIDNKGERVEPAILRGIMAQIVLREHPGATICYDIRPGRITRDMIEENGGVPLVTKVGHTLIKKVAIEAQAPFAGESSGHFFFNTPIGLFEMPMIVILKILLEISTSGRSLADIVAPLRKYWHSGEINSQVEDKEGKMETLAQLHKDGKISRLDGLTVEFDTYWYNVRPSNTEPLLRLNLEAVSKSEMHKRRDEILAIIRG